MKRLVAIALLVSCDTTISVTSSPKTIRVEVDSGDPHYDAKITVIGAEHRVEIVYVPTPFYAGCALAEKPTP